MNKNIITLPLLVLALSLSACASSSKIAVEPESSMNPKLKTSAIGKAMETALKQAEKSGNDQEILALLKQAHAISPKDPIVATRYARALREDDQINTAIRTLRPFTDGKNKNIEAITEMAMTKISLGDFKAAETYAKQATSLNNKNARAYLALGTAQDAQGRHQEAEVSFREGLKYWKGDPSPILNNLALNLASQGHLKQSLALLEKAKKLAPNRRELERNRRIIATLLEASGPQPPSPLKKPEENKETNSITNDVPSPKEKPKQKKETVKNVKEVMKPEDIKKDTKDAIKKPTYNSSEER